MTAEHWRKVKAVFQAALEVAQAERGALIESACGTDVTLRRDLERLLRAHDEAGHFIETPAAEKVSGNSAGESLLGERCGAYRVLRKIAQGGMGTVYLGVRDDEQYNKRVAIKVVQSGDTEEILRRFRHERQILATLDHPNIAKLIDGGTTNDGRPYFVMDYVDGMPIHEYCDTHRLSIGERLQHYRTVCSAVQHVHQILVVHRDLKPSNILVTADGVPKLLDFGIAKLLRPELLISAQDATRVELSLMTPGYASPEQVRGEPITTSSDVYSLGVVLYELLTGHRPYRWQILAPGEITRIVCEQEPDKPSVMVGRVEDIIGEGSVRTTITPESVSHSRETSPEKLRKCLDGDLDAIVMKAMRKEPRRRYISVEHLSDDVGQYLAGLPVTAHSDTVRYRAGKFIRRHSVGVAAGLLVLISLLGGIVATTWQASVAQAERARAERRFMDVRKLANSFLFEFHDAIQNLPGSTPARELVVRKALEYLDSLTSESGGDLTLRLELGEAYRKVGDVQGNPLNPNLGDTAGAQESYRKALNILGGLHAGDPIHMQVRRSLALIHQKVADMQIFTGDLNRAAENARKSLAAYQALAKDTPDATTRRLLATSHLKVGDVLGNPGYPNLGDRAGALQQYESADAILAAMNAAAPSDSHVRRLQSVIQERIGYLSEAEGKLREAEGGYARALAITQSLAAESPNGTATQRDLASGYARMGKILTLKGEFGKAQEHYRKSLALLEPLATADPSNAYARRSLAQVYVMTGDCLRQAGDRIGAGATYRKGLAILEESSKADPKNVALRSTISDVQESLAALNSR